LHLLIGYNQINYVLFISYLLRIATIVPLYLFPFNGFANIFAKEYFKQDFSLQF